MVDLAVFIFLHFLFAFGAVFCILEDFAIGENHMDNFIIYNTDDGQAKVSLLAKDGTVWCTQAQMAE